MKVLVASLIKNEAQRFLPSALKAWGAFADSILILDDNSEDESVEICHSQGVEVLSSRLTKAAWGQETPCRARLWNEAQTRTEPGDFIFILDADMVPAKNPKPLLENCADSDGVAFTLYDLWCEYSDGMMMYREDEFWQGHRNFRVWMVRRQEKPKEGWKWSGRGIHSGHFPLNLPLNNLVYAPQDYALLHYAYIDSKLRNAKFEQYYAVRSQLTEFEINHAKSIIDQNPKLHTLEFEPEFRLKKVL